MSANEVSVDGLVGRPAMAFRRHLTDSPQAIAYRRSSTGFRPAAIVVLVVLLVAMVGGAVAIYQLLTASGAPPIIPPAVRCQATIDDRTASLTLEQSRNASIIAGIAAQRGLAPRAVSIAITTAFQESGIRNLDYGDRDSLGMFQQRPSQGWGTPEQVMDPYYATGKFFDEMVKVDDWSTADIGGVAQEVQRSGFPEAYDKHVATARLLASSLSGQTPASWSCVVRDPAAADPGRLSKVLKPAYGDAVTVRWSPASDTAPAIMTLSTTTPEVAWSAAAFAQSWASQTGVTAVKLAGASWTASPDALPGWVTIPDDATISDTTVLVVF